jgi:MFS family permease
LQAGLLMTPFAAAQLIFAPQSAGMVRRFGPKAVCAVGLGLVTIGLIGFAFVGATTPLWVLIVLTFIQGSGMANVIPPATESIMSSLPREKAGVGSAVSNTIRQVGGALGVAVLGAILAAVYRSQIGDAVAGLPGTRARCGDRVAVRRVRRGREARPGRRSTDRLGQRRFRQRHALGGGRLGRGLVPGHLRGAGLAADGGRTRTTRPRRRT